MEFWGVEFKAGKPVKVTPEEDTLVHISQASLGDCKNKKGETVHLYVKAGEQKIVVGTLSSESIPQVSFGLVFEKEFEISHKWGKGSVYFVGYKSPNIEDNSICVFTEGGESFSVEDSEEEEVPATINAAKAVAKPKAKPDEVKKIAKPESSDDNSSDLCVICLKQKYNAAFLPCGHMCCCITCSSLVKTCPLCRGPISRVLKIYRH